MITCHKSNDKIILYVRQNTGAGTSIPPKTALISFKENPNKIEIKMESN